MGDRVLFVERAGELRYVARLSTERYGAEAKASLNRANSCVVVDPKPGDLPMARVKRVKLWRPEPTHVEKCGDEVWVAEKFQSNSEIAGSPRNSFRASLEVKSIGGRALNGLGALTGYRTSQTPNANTYTRESDCE
jgi:hypothetical protein